MKVISGFAGTKFEFSTAHAEPTRTIPCFARMLKSGMFRFPHRPLSRVLLAILALLAGYQTYGSLRVQKSLGWDAAMGFLTLQSSREYGDFNRLHHPNLEDLSQDQSEFISWWTPGQYLVPAGVARVLGGEMGFALCVVTLVCSWSSLLGLYLLYTRLGFSRLCVGLSLMVISSQHFFLKNGKVYSGGDLLLFAVAPYLALSVLSAGTSVCRRAVIAALLCFAAVFLKASALTVFLSLVLYLALEILGWPGGDLLPRSGGGVRLKRLMVLGVVFGLFFLATQLTYLSGGVTISSFTTPFRPDFLWGIPVSLAGPLYGAFSFLEPWSTKVFFIPLALLGSLIVWRLVRDGGHLDYRRILAAHYVAFVVFFSYAYLRGMSISYEPRHFRILGVLLVPGLIHWLLANTRQTVVACAIAALSLASLTTYHGMNHSEATAVPSASRWGIRQPLSNESLSALHRVDRDLVTRDTIVVNGLGACPALLLEFEHGRKLQHDNFATFGFRYSGVNTAPLPWYRKGVESIVLVVSKNDRWYFGPSFAEIAQTFELPLRVAPCFENGEIVIYRGSVR